MSRALTIREEHSQREGRYRTAEAMIQEPHKRRRTTDKPPFQAQVFQTDLKEFNLSLPVRLLRVLGFRVSGLGT